MSFLRKYETKFKIKLRCCFISNNVRVMVAGDMGMAFTCSGATFSEGSCVTAPSDIGKQPRRVMHKSRLPPFQTVPCCIHAPSLRGRVVSLYTDVMIIT